MSLLLQEMRRTYAAQRGVSQGASITLAAVSGGYAARLECAEKAARILGTREYVNIQFPHIFIPMQDAYSAITKLAETFSVALVDTVTDECGTRFVLVWKINPVRWSNPASEIEKEMQVAVVESQGSPSPFDLDEY